ncbi:MAG: PLP-dependent aminotransferase family protein, partial [Advenella sp.]
MTSQPISPVCSPLDNDPLLSAQQTSGDPAAQKTPLLAHWQPVRSGSQTLVDQIVDRFIVCIEQNVFRQGSRLPSVRLLAQELNVSRYTIVEAYDRLVATNHVTANARSGYFVQHKKEPARGIKSGQIVPPLPEDRIDVPWILNRLFSQQNNLGLKPEWIDSEIVARSIRKVARKMQPSALMYGEPFGFAPLRQTIVAQLAAQDLHVQPAGEVLLTTGVTHSVDLLIRQLVRPGDYVVVEEPCWFVAFAYLRMVGVNILTVARTPQGPDMAQLETHCRKHKPVLFICNSTVHNPTGFTLSASAAHDVLRLAQQYDMWIVEDDTYSELGAGPPLRISTLGQCERTFLLGNYSKTLGAAMRVGYIAGPANILSEIAMLKLLSGLSTSSLNERVIYEIINGGHYRSHIERLRQRINSARTHMLARLSAMDYALAQPPAAGLFLWLDMTRDAEPLARQLNQRNIPATPGSLFYPDQRVSTYLRLSVSSWD